MLKHIFATLTFVTLASSFGACSSSSSGGGSTPACQTPANDPTYTSKSCDNAADRCLLEAHEADVRKVGGACATTAPPAGCLTADNLNNPYSAAAVQCFQDCFARELPKTSAGATTSAACSLCSYAVVQCGAQFCKAECLSDPNATGCTQCLCATHTPDAGGPSGNCLQDAFARCAGFRPTNAQIGCP